MTELFQALLHFHTMISLLGNMMKCFDSEHPTAAASQYKA